MKNFGYQAERFRLAVHALMLPHPRGEDDSIAAAFRECQLAFQDLDVDDLDEGAREWVQKLKEFMRTDGPGGGSYDKWLLKAQGLTVEQKHELSSCVYELNAWFHMYFWSAGEKE